MNKAILAILLIIIIAMASGTWLLLSQIKEQKPSGVEINNNLPNDVNQTHNVKITDFKWTSGWETPGGVQAIMLFNITIHNLETKDIDGLTVEVKMLANSSELESATAFFGPGIIGESAEIEPIGVFHAEKLESSGE